MKFFLNFSLFISFIINDLNNLNCYDDLNNDFFYKMISRLRVRIYVYFFFYSEVIEI